jgi:hypothetical protein
MKEIYKKRFLASVITVTVLSAPFNVGFVLAGKDYTEAIAWSLAGINFVAFVLVIASRQALLNKQDKEGEKL